MAHISKPLVIVALPPCNEWEELDKLEKQGHTVIRSPGDLVGADIIIGSNCWRMENAHKPYLASAIKEARMLRYQPKAHRADTIKRAAAVDDVGLTDEDSKENN